jgi:hypothetical protein
MEEKACQRHALCRRHGRDLVELGILLVSGSLGQLEIYAVDVFADSCVAVGKNKVMSGSSQCVPFRPFFPCLYV